MRIVIRADASTNIGTGHIMRCLTLADVLRRKGCEIVFVCRNLPGNLNHLIAAKGYLLRELAVSALQDCQRFDWLQDGLSTVAVFEQMHYDVDWLVIDHYELDYRWHHILRPYTRGIMVIDDLADRVHDCDLLLDQNLYHDMGTRYRGLVPHACRCFFGPRFALLRDEFKDLRRCLRQRDGIIRRVLVSFGGSDPTNETLKVLEILKKIVSQNVVIDVVVGDANPRKEEVRRYSESLTGVNYYCQTDNMARLMYNADLAIGAGGSTTWERCCLGLPCIIIAVAQNQEAIAAECGQSGAGFYAGPAERINQAHITELIEFVLSSPSIVRTTSRKALQLVDGLGTERITDSVLGKGRHKL